MTRYLPIALGVLLIVGLTIVQGRMTDRLSGKDFTAEQKAELLKNVPMNIGNWHGEDRPVDEAVRETAGAVGAVSRVYRNVRTGDVVDLWLIVGHGRVISAHTPDVCYRSSGFSARAKENSLYPMVFENQPETPFLTNTFIREDVTGRRLIRVFWTWHNTESKDNDVEIVWEAPSNARWHFGNTRALYKMYFTAEMRDPLETAEQSPCLRFARDFLPVVNQALAEVHGDSKPREAADEPAAAAEKEEKPEAPAASEVEVSDGIEFDDAATQEPAPSETPSP
jgi:hypothetical protein